MVIGIYGHKLGVSYMVGKITVGALKRGFYLAIELQGQTVGVNCVLCRGKKSLCPVARPTHFVFLFLNDPKLFLSFFFFFFKFLAKKKRKKN